jgi:cytoskeleton protein RodZ
MTMFEIGEGLRDTRLARGLELVDVAEATMIRARYLAALETERFELLPGDAYTRLFLSDYATFLGLDPQPFLDQLSARDEEDEPLPFVAPVPSRHRDGHGGLLALAIAATVAVAIGLVAWKKLSGAGSHRLPARPQAGLLAPAPVRRPHPAPTVQKPVGPHLVLTATRGPVWLLVRMGSTDGRALYENILQTGQTLAFGRRTLWIRVGAPRNLDLRLDGRPASLPPSSAPENVLVPARGSLKPA